LLNTNAPLSLIFRHQYKRYRRSLFCAVKPTLWLLNPRLDFLKGFSIWYFWIPDQDTKIDKEKLFSTSWKYCLWYKAVTKLHLHSIYCICLNGWIPFFTIWLNYSVKSAMTPNNFLCFLIITYCFTYLKSFAILMPDRFIVKNVSKSCKKALPWLQLLKEKDKMFPQIHQIAKMFCTDFK